MKNFIYLLISAFIISCSTSSGSGVDYEKRIYQHIDMRGMGMLKDIEVQSVEKKSETLVKGVHTFFNPMFEREMRVTNEYTFEGDSIVSFNSIKSEIKSQDEWVEQSF